MGLNYITDSDIVESLESIYYQLNTPLKEFLINSMERCIQAYAENNTDVLRTQAISEIFVEVSESIKKRTGISFIMHVMSLPIVGYRYNVNVSIPKTKVASAVSSKLSDRELSQLISGKYEHLEMVKGSMNLEQLKVTGFYSDINFDFNMDLDFFKPDFLNASELAAIVFHEMGHAWDYMYGLGEAARNGAITGAVFDTLRGPATIEKKLSLVRILSPVLGKDIEDVDGLSDDEIVALIQANSFTRRSIASESTDYGLHMVEFIADQFASRHGLAHALASAQRKLESTKIIIFRNDRYRPYWFGGSLLLMDVFSLVSLPYTFIRSAGQLTLKKIATSLSRDLIISWFTTTFTSFLGPGRLDPKIRLDVIRTDLISVLKDKSTDEATKRAILSDLKMLDEEIGNLNIELESPFSLIAKYVNNLRNTDLRSFKSTLNTNALTNNRLYELAEKLKLGAV